MINYYHRFLPGIAHTMAPLYTALAGKPKNLVWGSLEADAFKKTKDSLASAALLAFPAPGSPLIVTMDAIQLGLDYNHFAREQKQDPEASATRTSITSLQWTDVPLNDSGQREDYQKSVARSWGASQDPRKQGISN
ncbi:hypothetical protein Pcinc_004215 [Petrolisthes cinctipes]|uniref:Reverse transcriptase/retrotransposon-derived protein RNase H-like domain-containing protein n=1 Tax=Petrolisthes cinctipes TaxID=88211 RepID=A0AAE1L0H4_PETCI|nr:hypothetical protein Pcinc_004215 [Petrolisthes cinctipes]